MSGARRLKFAERIHVVVPTYEKCSDKHKLGGNEERGGHTLLLSKVDGVLLGAEGHTDTLNIVGAARVKLSCYEHILGVGSTDEEA